MPWAHTIFSNLKTWLRGTYHGVSKKHLDRYLQEFVYRFNRRRFEHALFEHVIRAATTAPPLTYEGSSSVTESSERSTPSSMLRSLAFCGAYSAGATPPAYRQIDSQGIPSESPSSLVRPHSTR